MTGATGLAAPTPTPDLAAVAASQQQPRRDGRIGLATGRRRMAHFGCRWDAAHV
jgi:hypothetical protein